MALTWQDIVSAALLELNITAAGDVAAPDDAAFALPKVNRLLDNWNAERAAVYNEVLATFTLTPNLSPHTIGPTGTWVVTQRPVSIDGANLVVSNISTPIRLRDREWWLGQATKTQTSTFPTDLYYDPAWANGKLNFWPVPTSAYAVDLMYRAVLASVVLTDTFSLPPGYQDAITLTLAEELAGAYEKPVPASLARSAAFARARIFGNNDVAPRIATRDAGMPGGRGGTYNYKSGTWG